MPIEEIIFKTLVLICAIGGMLVLISTMIIHKITPKQLHKDLTNFWISKIEKTTENLDRFVNKKKYIEEEIKRDKEILERLDYDDSNYPPQTSTPHSKKIGE